ncbi:MAG: UDP-glucose 4-epimerase, partial [uncultured Rubrobacteraceae bacterium]
GSARKSPHHRWRGFPRYKPRQAPALPRLRSGLPGPRTLRLPRTRPGRRADRRHPRQGVRGPGRRGRGLRGPHGGGAAPLLGRGHLHHGRRGHAQRARRLPAPRREAGGACVLDGGLRHTGPPPALRDGQAGGGRAVRSGQDPGRDGLPGVPREGPDGPHHPPQVLCGPREARGLRPLLRLGPHGARLPHDRLGQQPLPAPGRRGPVRRHRPLPHPAGGAGRRHLQHRGRRVHHDEGGLPGRPRRGRARQEDSRLPRGPRHRRPAHPRPPRRLPPLQVGLRDGLQGLLRLHREGAGEARVRAEVLQQGGSTQELPLVPGEPQGFRERLGRLPPGAVEAGRYRAAQAVLL